MEVFDLISSIWMSILSVDELMDEAESHQESQKSRRISHIHMPPPQDDGGESGEEGESEEGEEFSDASEYFEAFEVINMDIEYLDSEEYLEESCLRLIVALGHSMIPTAQSMMTTARSMIPSLPALESTHSDSESETDYDSQDEDGGWSRIGQQ